MSSSGWQKFLIPTEVDDPLRELFHENSKLSRFDAHPSDEDILKEVAGMHEALPYEGYPIIDLPETLLPLSMSLGEALERRRSSQTFNTKSLSVATIGTLLSYNQIWCLRV